MNSHVTPTESSVPSPEVLIERARAMIPVLRSRTEQVEKDRSVPTQTIQEFMDAGFFRVLQPRRWGGWEMSPEVFWRILMELGRGCSSSAWNMMILGVHQWEFGQMDPQAGDDVWGQDNRVLVASSYAPTGNVKKVDGGYLLSGRWPTSSGGDHGQWAFLGGNLKDDQGQVIDRCSFLVSRQDYELIDDWHVFGLCGTGSKSLVVKEAFVPEHRMHSIIDYRLDDRGAMYLWPFLTVFCASVSAVLCGFGQQAVDIYSEQMKTRLNTGNGLQAALSPYVRDRLGNAVVRIQSARGRLFQLMAETTPQVMRRELLSMDQRVQYACEIAQVGRNIEEAVLLLFKATGARGIFLDNPIQKVLRDVLVASNHITQNGDDTAGVLGGYLLGAPLPPLQFEPIATAA